MNTEKTATTPGDNDNKPLTPPPPQSESRELLLGTILTTLGLLWRAAEQRKAITYQRTNLGPGGREGTLNLELTALPSSSLRAALGQKQVDNLTAQVKAALAAPDVLPVWKGKTPQQVSDLYKGLFRLPNGNLFFQADSLFQSCLAQSGEDSLVVRLNNLTEEQIRVAQSRYVKDHPEMGLLGCLVLAAFRQNKDHVRKYFTETLEEPVSSTQYDQVLKAVEKAFRDVETPTSPDQQQQVWLQPMREKANAALKKSKMLGNLALGLSLTLSILFIVLAIVGIVFLVRNNVKSTTRGN